jgi:hypothetical protein
MDSVPESASQGREGGAPPETALAAAIRNPLSAWEPQARAFLLASKAVNTTLVRRLTAISAHQAAGHPSPASTQHACVNQIIKGIKRTVGTAQPGKEPLFTVEIRKMIVALPANLQGRTVHKEQSIAEIGDSWDLPLSARMPGCTLQETRTEDKAPQ